MEQIQIEQGIRLQQLMKALNLKQTGFARSLGMTQPNISRMVTGESKISVEVINRIIDTYKTVNLHWLLTGDGAMFMDEPEEKSVQVKEPGGHYSPKGKGRLEELEERVERLEEAVWGLKGGKEK
mgnify:CR=1 FL=1|jgi:transcriptional regulator with XRE-family HTH domain